MLRTLRWKKMEGNNKDMSRINEIQTRKTTEEINKPGVFFNKIILTKP